MKKLLFTIGCTIVLLELYGQDCEGFYPMNKGNVMELTSYNEKGQAAVGLHHHHHRPRLLALMESPCRCTAVHATRKVKAWLKWISMRAARRAFLHEHEKHGLSEERPAWKDMDMKMSGTDLQIPLNAAPGQTLPDGSFMIEVSMNGMKMPGMSIEVTDLKVVAEEAITTAAGTFTCLKITSKVKSKWILPWSLVQV